MCRRNDYCIKFPDLPGVMITALSFLTFQMAANDQNALPEGNLPPAVKTARPPSELYLDELTQGSRKNATNRNPFILTA
ncbi:hypothetical protein Tco_1281751 [Tanacetum coccineum]